MFVRLVVAFGLLAASAQAQSAHFTGAQTTLISSSNFPNASGVATDPSGNLYVADSSQQAIYQVSASSGYSSVTQLVSTGGSFNGFVRDSGGQLYISFGASVAVYALSSGVYLRQVTFNGFTNASGLTMDAGGNLYIADAGGNAIYEVASGTGTAMQIATNLPSASGIAVDGSGNLFVSCGDNTIREIPAASDHATSTVLVGSFSFHTPMGLALDSSGNLFVADEMNNQVEEISAATGYNSVVILGGGFIQPQALAVDSGGNLLVADTGNHAIQKVILAGAAFGSAAVGTAAGATVSLHFTFDTSGSIAIPLVLTSGAANLDFSDAGTGSCTTNGTSHVYNSGDSCTVDVVFTPGQPGPRNGGVTLVNASGTLVANGLVSGVGTGPHAAFSPPVQTTISTSVGYPWGTAVDGSGNIFVAGHNDTVVSEFMASTGYNTVTTIGSGFFAPKSLAIDGNGNLFVADALHIALKEIVAAGGYTTINTIASNIGIAGIAVDGQGNVFVNDSYTHTVIEFFALGGYSISRVIASGVDARALAVDASGNLFMADSGNQAVKEATVTSGYNDVVTLATGFGPDLFGIAVDLNGNVFVADYDNQNVTEIFAAGGYTSSSSIGSGWSGPIGLAVDSHGNLIVCDFNNSRVVKFDSDVPPVLSFASTPYGAISSDSPRLITLVNTGNEALLFPAPNSGLNPNIGNSFYIDELSTCPVLTTSSSPFSLAPGDSCTYLAGFQPGAIGALSSSLVITDNSLNSAGPSYASQSIALSGTATAISPAITFTVSNHTYGDAPFPVAAASNSSAAFSYSVVSGPATVLGSTVTLTGVGTVVLLASQAASGNYLTGSQTATFTVAGEVPVIAFSVASHTFGDAPFVVNATSSSTGAFSYSVVSGPATISGSTVTLTGVGTVVLQASQAASGNYLTGSQTATFTVASEVPVIVFSVASHTFGDAPFAVNATSSSTGVFSYSVVSGPATISGAMVTVTAAGTVVLMASQAATGNYSAGSATATFTVATAVELSPGTGSSTAATVSAGGAANFVLAMSPEGSNVFTGNITFTVTGLPADATATFSPAMISAGSPATNVNLTVQTSQATPHQRKQENRTRFHEWAFLFLPLALSRKVRRQMRVLPLWTMVLCITSLLFLAGCGAGSSTGASAKTYELVVSASNSANAATTITNLTLTVE